MKKIITILALCSMFLTITGCTKGDSEIKNDKYFKDNQETNLISGQDVEIENDYDANQKLIIPEKTITTTVADITPDGKDFEKIDISAYTLPATVNEVYRKDGGFVIKLVTSGYSKGLAIMCSVDSEGNITDSVCLESFETLGYEKEYGKNAVGMNSNTIENIDTVAGATKTTGAYKKALKDALNSFVILNGGTVDIRTKEEILADNLSAALPVGNVKFKKLFLVELIENVDAVYATENGAGYVFVVGEQFIGVLADGTVVTEGVENTTSITDAVALIQATTLEEIDISAYPDLEKTVVSAFVTSSGNYVIETKGAGYGIKGGNEYRPASGEYIIVRVSITPDGKIIDCITVSEGETDGIGDACADEDFYGQFVGKTEDNYTEIDAIGGATLTTNGYKQAVERAFKAVEVLNSYFTSKSEFYNKEELSVHTTTCVEKQPSSHTANNTEYFIGCTGPLTGSASSYGIRVKEGATLAIEEINANGGLNGVKFKLDIKDDQADRDKAYTAYDQLFEAGMQISLGSVTSGSCEVFATKADADDMFYITPSASAEYCIEPDNGFRICFGDTDQGVLAAKELAAKYENIGVIYDASDIYSTLIYEAFEDEMANLGKEYLVQTFDAEKRKDFSTQVEVLKGCDVIFLPIYYTEASLVAKACVNEGCDALIFGCDGFDGIADQVDETVTNTIKYITPFDVNSTDENVRSFVDAYTAKYNKAPDQFAADGYDAIMVIFEAMKKAGIDDVTIYPETLCEKIIAVITAEDFVYVGATGTMTWDVSGTCIKVPTIIELKK